MSRQNDRLIINKMRSIIRSFYRGRPSLILEQITVISYGLTT